MSNEYIITEIRKRFRIPLDELRRKQESYEIELYCNALKISEETYHSAVKNIKRK